MAYLEKITEIGKWIFFAVLLSGITYELILRMGLIPLHLRIKAFITTRRILENNRPTRNGGGKYTADRMLDLWNNGAPTPLLSRRGVIYQAAGRRPSVHWESAIDELLQKENLVTRYEWEGRTLVKLNDSPLAKKVLRSLVRMVEKRML